MKIFRSFPLIAAAILGLIGFGLYKTSNFVNNKVAAEQQLSSDSLAANPITFSPNQPLGDTLSTPSTQLTAPTNADITAPIAAIKSTEAAVLEAATPALTAIETNEAPKADASKSEGKKMTNKSPKSAKLTTNKTVVSAKEAAPKAVAAPRFHVIVGTYKVEANAKANALKYEKQALKKTSVLKYKGLYRVSIDNFDSEVAAAKYASQLKEAGEKTIIVKF